MPTLHLSQVAWLCFVDAGLFVLVAAGYATWKGTHSLKRWTALGSGFVVCIAGAFAPDLISLATVIIAPVLFLIKDLPTIGVREAKDGDEAPFQTTRKWDSGPSENERIVDAYEQSLTRGVDAHGHLVDPTPEFKKLADEDR